MSSPSLGKSTPIDCPFTKENKQTKNSPWKLITNFIFPFRELQNIFVLFSRGVEFLHSNKTWSLENN